MRFEKWHGIGNAYLVMEQADLPLELTAARVERICHPDMGAGSDGILVISGDGAAARVRILNPDGSEAEFSGNGTRIAAGYLLGRDGGDEVAMDTLKDRSAACAGPTARSRSMPAAPRWSRMPTTGRRAASRRRSGTGSSRWATRTA